MGDYLRAVWRCRYFWLSLVKMDLRTRYRRSVLGLGWSLLQPLAMTAILCTVFHKLFDKSVHEYAPLLLSGLACWNYIVYVTQFGCQCFYQGEGYIRQYPAPLAIYPLRTALGGLVHFLIALGMVVALVWGLDGFGNLARLPALLPGVLLLFALVWSLALLAGFANVYFRDTQHLTEVGFQILFYATPIIYEAEWLEKKGLGWWVQCNPLVPFLRLIREPILEGGRMPSAETYLAAAVIAAAAVALAGYSLSRLERRLIFYL